MRRRETILIGLAISSVAVVAVSCALNAGGIVYVVADSGLATTNDSGEQTLPDGAIVTPDGSVVTPDGGPLGKCGADQVDIDAGFCIDKKEVTNAAYVTFLEATGGDAGNDFSPCTGVSLNPNNSYELVTAPNHPVRGVNWCGARAYCEWAGKRLCGTLADGGEDAIYTYDFQDAAANEWEFACTANGAHSYPYGGPSDGGGYDAGACNGSDLGEGGVVDVGSLPGCNGGYPGLLDMSGNVAEWENACADDTNASAQCRLRGGAFDKGKNDVACGADYSGNRNTTSSSNAGIRCCADEK
jgi:formylglycine-generating enzyme required for sulfatase activity